MRQVFLINTTLISRADLGPLAAKRLHVSGLGFQESLELLGTSLYLLKRKRTTKSYGIAIWIAWTRDRNHALAGFDIRRNHD